MARRLSATAIVFGAATVFVADPSASAASADSNAEAHAALSGCGGNMPAQAWWSTGQANCSHWGRPGAVVTYSWHSLKGDGYNAVQVRGFDGKGRSTWYGCGWAASGKCTVSWGDYIATPKARAMNKVHADHIYFTVN
ncbi:hypothetical protein AB0L06_36220 [Spirillospora sp. NPDC052269]